MEFKYDFYQSGKISPANLVAGLLLFLGSIYLLFTSTGSRLTLEFMNLLIGLYLILRGLGIKPGSFFGRKMIEVNNLGMHFKLNSLRKGQFYSRNDVTHLDIWPGKIRIDAGKKNKTIDITELSPQLRHDLLMAVIGFAKENKINHKKHGYLEYYQ